MNIESQLLDSIRTLAPDKQAEVLDFIEFIRQRTPASDKEPRPIGLCKGDFTLPDDFDAPLPEEDSGSETMRMFPDSTRRWVRVGFLLIKDPQDQLTSSLSKCKPNPSLGSATSPSTSRDEGK